MVLDQTVGSILLIVAILWLGGLTFWIYKTKQGYRRLISTADKADLPTIFGRLLDKQTKFEAGLKTLEEQLVLSNSRALRNIQKIGLVRFSPYADTGGHQSFALSLLNGNDTGVVVLSLHSREGTRVYIKAVKRGVGERELSKEERQAVEEAKKGKVLN